MRPRKQFPRPQYCGAKTELLNLLCELAGIVLGGHHGKRDRLDAGALTLATELKIALLAQFVSGLTGLLEVFARIELFGVLEKEAARGGGHCQTNVRVDVDLAHAVLDGFLNFGNGHAIGFAHAAAEFADFSEVFLRNGARAVHHKVGVGQTFVDFLDALDRKNFTGGLARELVSAVARADGDGQSVELGFTHSAA